MGTPLFYPSVKYTGDEKMSGMCFTVAQLCEKNGISCRLTGPSTLRKVFLMKSKVPTIVSLPNQGSVQIHGKWRPSSKQAHKYALAVMAYAVFDLTARESIRGNRDFSEISLIGRPRKGRTKTNAERQRMFRQKHPQIK